MVIFVDSAQAMLPKKKIMRLICNTHFLPIRSLSRDQKVMTAVEVRRYEVATLEYKSIDLSYA